MPTALPVLAFLTVAVSLALSATLSAAVPLLRGATPHDRRYHPPVFLRRLLDGPAGVVCYLTTTLRKFHVVDVDDGDGWRRAVVRLLSPGITGGLSNASDSYANTTTASAVNAPVGVAGNALVTVGHKPHYMHFRILQKEYRFEGGLVELAEWLFVVFLVAPGTFPAAGCMLLACLNAWRRGFVGVRGRPEEEGESDDDDASP